MATIKRDYYSGPINPVLKEAEYRVPIGDLIISWEPKFEDDVMIILHLSQWNGLSAYEHKPTKISDDQKVIDAYYQISGKLDKRTNKITAWESPSDVIASLTRIFERLPNRKLK